MVLIIAKRPRRGSDMAILAVVVEDVQAFCLNIIFVELTGGEVMQP
jgi:hypothetical protein